MKNLFDTALRGLLLATLLVLAACGPGGGGTGTGPISFTGLGTTSTATPGPSTPTGGTAGDCTDCARVDVQLLEAQVELTTPCSRFVFEGPWTQDASGVVSVTGRYETPSLGRTVVATLRLQFSAGAASSQSVTATLFSEAGQLLLGPVTLSRQATLDARPAPASCP